MPSKIKISKDIANLKGQIVKKVNYFNYDDFIKLKNKINKYYNKNKEEILEDELQIIKRQNELYREKRNFLY